ncbi:MAG TPA: TetR/AcrR family transcriptional regulator [Candidatus Acidoferrales bacterium]|nr:TetR/AcrR family transcriptional regulator [Candidatus Acidoferrales bacterium]
MVARRGERAKRGAVIPLPTTARGQRTRQKLIDSAEAVFGERGFHNAGIVEITQRADVALGTFYLYFPDKRSIFEDLVHTLNTRLRRTIAAEVREIDDRLEQEVVGFETFFEFVRKHRNLYRVILQAETVDDDLYRWHYRTLAEGYVQGLRKAQAAGQVRSDLDAETLAYSLMGMAESLGSRYVLWDGKRPPAATRRTIRAFLESGLRGKPRRKS